MKKIGIIGAGASGITAGIVLKRKGYDVTIFEKNSTPLKKLSITGAGKCNYFNENITKEKYNSYTPNEIERFINDKNVKKAKEFFDSMGIVSKNKDNYLYPYSQSAVSFKNILLTEARILGINFIYENVTSIYGNKVYTDKEYNFDKIVLAVGTGAAIKDYNSSYVFDYLDILGVKYHEFNPALVGLIIDKNHLDMWAGIRCEVKASLYEDDDLITSEIGEMQCTKDGVSGICIMNLSSKVRKGLNQNKNVYIKIDFMHFIENDTYEYIENRNNLLPGRTIVELLESILNYKLIYFILKNTKIDPNSSWDDLSEKDREKLVRNLREFSLKIVDTKSTMESQVCSGGVSLLELNDDYSLKKNPDIYVIGELADIDGACGGYNLGHAFISAVVLGENI